MRHFEKYAEAKYKSAASKKSAASSAFRVSRFGFRVSNFAFRVLRHLKKMRHLTIFGNLKICGIGNTVIISWDTAYPISSPSKNTSAISFVRA
jgi:hypothetical protein